MIAGVQPFKALTPYLSLERTKKAEYTVPSEFDPVAHDLVASLLVVEAKDRLGDIGRGGPSVLRAHSFFEGTPWEKIWEMDPPRLGAGLVKNEPAKRKKRATGDVQNGFGEWGDDLSLNAERGEAWNDLVQDRSEDEMSDELEHSSGASTRPHVDDYQDGEEVGIDEDDTIGDIREMEGEDQGDEIVDLSPSTGVSATLAQW
jgi:hypothetical protein